MSTLRRPLLLAIALAGALSPALLPETADAASMLLSTRQAATLGGLGFTSGDAVEYDDVADLGTLGFDGSAFSASEDVDALHRLPNGHWLLSTRGGAEIGGTVFQNGDVIDYDPLADSASLFFSESEFASGADIDAISMHPNGNLLLSTRRPEILAGVNVRDGDIVEYDIANDIASILFSESAFAANEDVDAFHLMDDGSFVLSTRGAADLAGLAFGKGDLVRFDPSTSSASLYFSEASFVGGDEQVDAAFIPEPETGWLLGAGLLGLGVAGRRRSGTTAGDSAGKPRRH